jgi:hypothetical protein
MLQKRKRKDRSRSEERGAHLDVLISHFICGGWTCCPQSTHGLWVHHCCSYHYRQTVGGTTTVRSVAAAAARLPATGATGGMATPLTMYMHRAQLLAIETAGLLRDGATGLPSDAFPGRHGVCDTNDIYVGMAGCNLCFNWNFSGAPTSLCACALYSIQSQP